MSLADCCLFTARYYHLFKTSPWLEGIGQELTLGTIGYARFFWDLGIRSVTGEIFGLCGEKDSRLPRG